MLGEIFDLIYNIFNPLPAKFMNYYYPLFFLINILLLIYFLKNNKKQINEIKKLISKKSIIILIFILSISTFNMLYCMNPDNNLPPVGTDIMDETENYYNNLHFNKIGRPMGVSTILIVLQIIPINISYLMSIIGIFFQLLTTLMLYLLFKKNIKNESVSILGCLLFSFSYSIINYFSSEISGLVISTFSITLLALLYSLNNKDTKTLLFATTLTLFGRVENIIFILIFLYHYYNNKINWKYLIAGYLLLLPNIEVARYWKWYTEPQHGFAFGINNILNRFISFFTIIFNEFTFLIILLIIGIYFNRKKIIIWIPILLIIFLLFFQQYEHIHLRYLIPLFPIFYLFITSSKNLIKNKWIFIIIFILLSLNLNFIFFEKIEDNYFIRVNKEASNLTKDTTILYTYDKLGKYFSKYYNNVTVIPTPSNKYPGKFEYLVDLSEYEYSKKQIEKDLKLNLTLIKDMGITTVYKIN
jgi:hypothetical protein